MCDLSFGGHNLDVSIVALTYIRDANGSQINHEPARPKMIPAEHIDHGTVEGRQIFYDQVCYLLRKKCK
ncbi:unnamed protein product, partial [Mesorhabditis spiculigera]